MADLILVGLEPSCITGTSSAQHRKRRNQPGTDTIRFQVSAAATDGCWDSATSPTLPYRCRNSQRFGAATLPCGANRSPRTTHHEVQNLRKHQSYDDSTEVTARTTIRSPRTQANTSVSRLFNLETPVLRTTGSRP